MRSSMLLNSNQKEPCLEFTPLNFCSPKVHQGIRFTAHPTAGHYCFSEVHQRSSRNVNVNPGFYPKDCETLPTATFTGSDFFHPQEKMK